MTREKIKKDKINQPATIRYPILAIESHESDKTLYNGSKPFCVTGRYQIYGRIISFDTGAFPRNW